MLSRWFEFGAPAPEMPGTPNLATAAEPLDARTLDGIRALQRAGTPDLLRRIADLFLETVPAQIEQLRAAVLRSDAAAAQRVAHGLKSSSANIGALTLAACFKEIEQTGRSGTTAGMEGCVVEAVREYARVAQALTALPSEARHER
jgi:HPt (histidine-containing phosphotransfer) domain-containing protein